LSLLSTISHWDRGGEFYLQIWRIYFESVHELVLMMYDTTTCAKRPSRTVDVAWCVEFTEHVGRNFQLNYFTAFRKAAFIFMTHSQRGGWHHVEVSSGLFTI
jgi:hypothetical protein